MSYDVLVDRYALRDEHGNIVETDINQVFTRVANSLAESEDERSLFLRTLGDFVPAGRILAGAGLESGRATLGNCYVIPVEDTRESIFHSLGQSMEILSKGGGVGYNFSHLRPAGSPLVSSRGIASGPCSFISVFDAAAKTISQGGSRRAAQMGILNIDHPDVREFINFKRVNNRGDEGMLDRKWSTFNVSVGLTDNFIQSYRRGIPMPLVWHGKSHGEVDPEVLLRECAQLAWATGDPGLINLSAHNYWNNTGYFEEIEATNPCGEIGLPPYGVCFLGSLVLPRFVEEGYVQWDRLRRAVVGAVTLLDNAVSKNYYPTPETRERALLSRRIGLGTMGLADMLIILGLRYDSEKARDFVSNLWQFIMTTAYEASVVLASRKGTFPAFDRDAYLERPFVREKLPEHLRTLIRHYGIRNAVLLSQAPTGTISLLMGCSSGIEPNYDTAYWRHDNLGSRIIAHPLYEANKDVFVTAKSCSLIDHLRMQQVVHEWCDQSVSKTINLPNKATVDAVLAAYKYAIDHDFKGITVFRDGCIPGVLASASCQECETPLQAGDGCFTCPNCGWAVCSA